MYEFTLVCAVALEGHDSLDVAASHSIQYSVMFVRGNGVIHRGLLQGDDNGHVGRPCEVSLAPPCPELFCELRGLCRRSYFGPRTCGTSEKTIRGLMIDGFYL